MPEVLHLDTEASIDLVGGKGESLGRMWRAGLPVPAGFVVTTAAFRQGMTPELIEAIRVAYQQLGGGPVAVRSSAPAEDGAETSLAGQQDTFLGVEGTEAVVKAITWCWASLLSDRAVAYRRQQGLGDEAQAMAVVVQQLVPAEVAGVLFTQDPLDVTGRCLTVEASWGLGEVVVSGRVTPDRFRLDRQTGAVIERHLGAKTVQMTTHGEMPVPADRQDRYCLSEAELVELAELGRRVETFFGSARDIEWARAAGRVWLVQARPITTISAVEREAVRAEVLAQLRVEAEPPGTVWVRDNLSEVLPTPTPMTWAVVGRLLAADGGFGAMYRDLGADPDPGLGSRSAYDLVAGRPMCNLSRLPRLQFRRPPFEYPYADLKADPRRALDPKPVPNPGRVGLRRLPGVLWRMSRMASTMRTQAATFADRFPRDIARPFIEQTQSAMQDDWAKLDPPALVERFRTWVDRTLVDFARHSLKATVFAELSWSTLLELLTPKRGAEQARADVATVALGAKLPARADLARGVAAFAAGSMTRDEFLSQFGHRCQNEMELAQPRWSEDPTAVNRLCHQTARGDRPEPLLRDIPPEAQVWAERLQIFLGLREAAKHDLLRGYAVIRRALVELDSRYGLRSGIFDLVPSELDALLAGLDLTTRIGERRTRRKQERSLEVPTVLFSEDLEAIGRPEPLPTGATRFQGVPLSMGSAEAPALVLTHPAPAPAEPYVLVCPSTDPAWVPLFVGAVALVMETGGVLSHGAIVAREFGLPAVAGLPGCTKWIPTGQRLRVDGARGTVAIVEAGSK